ncbi:MAG: hypothetical protein PHF83_07280 [Candidatus Methanomethylophilus sp.]|nr:hypothetical protein [Methanomethylophilus sp.]MDD4668916.1 hypothetical protein [Methanomethylophilus sp.]
MSDIAVRLVYVRISEARALLEEFATVDIYVDYYAVELFWNSEFYAIGTAVPKTCFMT